MIFYSRKFRKRCLFRKVLYCVIYGKSLNEHYGLEDEDISHPTNYKTIMQDQEKHKNF